MTWTTTLDDTAELPRLVKHRFHTGAHPLPPLNSVGIGNGIQRISKEKHLLTQPHAQYQRSHVHAMITPRLDRFCRLLEGLTALDAYPVRGHLTHQTELGQQIHRPVETVAFLVRCMGGTPHNAPTRKRKQRTERCDEVVAIPQIHIARCHVVGGPTP